MPLPSGAGPFLRAGLVAALALIVWLFTADAAAMPPLSPLGPQPGYSALDSPVLVVLEPVLHAAWVLRLPRAAIVVMAFVVLLGASGVAIFGGAGALAAAAVLTALVLDASFSAGLSHAANAAIAAGLVWLAAGAAFDREPRGGRTRQWFNPAAAVALWLVAVWCSWIAVVTWPIVLAAFRRYPRRPLRGVWTAASLIAGAAAFVAHFATMAAIATRLDRSGIDASWFDALTVAFDARPRMPMGSFSGPELTTRLGYLLMTLAALGVLFAAPGRWWRRAVLLSAALAAGVGLTWSEWQAEVFRFAIWAVAPLAAVGLSWAASSTRRPALLTIGLGAIAVAETTAGGAMPTDGIDARGFRDALTAALTQEGAAPLAIVAEDTRVDSALIPWMVAQERVGRVIQDGGAVAAALDGGWRVLAGPVAEQHLQLLGLTLKPALMIDKPALFAVSEVDERLRCAPVRADRWSQLPGLEYTGRLGVRLPGRLGGELQLVVGDTLPVRVRAETADRRPVALREEPLLSGPGAAAPPPDYWMDGSVPEAGPQWIRRVHLPADPLRPALLSVSLARRAPRVIARLVGYEEDARGEICAAVLGPVRVRQGEAPLPLEDENLFGTGWYGREGGGAAAFRWADRDAVMLVRSAARRAVGVTLEARAAVTGDASGPTMVTLFVNGVDVGERPMHDDLDRYTWEVPAGTWLAGTNELWWQTTRAVRPADTGGGDTRSLAMRVTGVRVAVR